MAKNILNSVWVTLLSYLPNLMLFAVGLLIAFQTGFNSVLGSSSLLIGVFLAGSAAVGAALKLVKMKNKLAEVIVGLWDNILTGFVGAFFWLNPKMVSQLPSFIHYALGAVLIVIAVGTGIMEIAKGIGRR